MMTDSVKVQNLGFKLQSNSVNLTLPVNKLKGLGMKSRLWNETSLSVQAAVSLGRDCS